VGSVGIVATLEVRDDEVSVTSTNAPNKRPDPTTAAGQAVIREELDAMHEIFAEAIATGRGTTIEKVNADFGQGATLLATTAESRGMIDSIAATKLAIVSTEPAASGNITGDSKMNLNELKAQHPELFAQVVQLGVDGERDRVAAHLTMGEASGDMATAVGAINDGSAMTAALQSKYMAAGMNRRDIEDRSGDDLSADGADGAAAPVAETEADLVAAAVEHNFGVEPATQPEA
jgi:ClpP class serine protease